MKTYAYLNLWITGLQKLTSCSFQLYSL